MSVSGGLLRIAVSTLVLAALAVSDGAACPLGRAVDLEQPVLPWMIGRADTGSSSRIAPRPRITPRVTMLAASSQADGQGVARTLRRIELRCGQGRGELLVRIVQGHASVTVSGFDPIVGDCVRRAVEQTRFTHVANDTLARVALELR